MSFFIWTSEGLDKLQPGCVRKCPRMAAQNQGPAFEDSGMIDRIERMVNTGVADPLVCTMDLARAIMQLRQQLYEVEEAVRRLAEAMASSIKKTQA